VPIFQLARAYCEQGKLDAAQQTLERGMILTENRPNVRGYADLRELYEEVLIAKNGKQEAKHDVRPKPHGHPGRHSMLIRNY
jgi:predicted negative regulator of RcsB-dependent stress response